MRRPQFPNTRCVRDVHRFRRTGAVTLRTVRGIPIRSRRDSNLRMNRSTVPGEPAAFIERGVRYHPKRRPFAAPQTICRAQDPSCTRLKIYGIILMSLDFAPCRLRQWNVRAIFDHVTMLVDSFRIQRDPHPRCDAAAPVQQGAQLDGSLGAAELGPGEQGPAQLDVAPALPPGPQSKGQAAERIPA